MKEIYIGKNNTMSIETTFDNCTINLKYSFEQRKEVEGNTIFLYKTFFIGGKYEKKYYVLKNLRFSYGGANNSIFHCNDIANNVIEIDNISAERDIKINELLNEC
jgi:hypothetical protein